MTWLVTWKTTQMSEADWDLDSFCNNSTSSYYKVNWFQRPSTKLLIKLPKPQHLKAVTSMDSSKNEKKKFIKKGLKNAKTLAKHY